jgi:CBS-domain-containing membrane protein
VIGSERLHHLGYAYEFSPILLNAFTILAVAVAFNYLFRWRRYPAHLQALLGASSKKAPEKPAIPHENFVYALSHIETLVDISEEELLEIYRLATEPHAEDKGRDTTA